MYLPMLAVPSTTNPISTLNGLRFGASVVIRWIKLRLWLRWNFWTYPIFSQNLHAVENIVLMCYMLLIKKIHTPISQRSCSRRRLLSTGPISTYIMDTLFVHWTIAIQLTVVWKYFKKWSYGVSNIELKTLEYLNLFHRIRNILFDTSLTFRARFFANIIIIRLMFTYIFDAGFV